MIDPIVGGLRDCVFFLVVAYLGLHHALGEPILAALLSAYTAHRFGVSMGKQSAVIALNNASPGGGGGGGAGSGSGGVGGGSGTSGTMRAVDPQAATTHRADPKTTAGTGAASDAVTLVVPTRTPDGLHLDTGAYRIVSGTVGGIG